LITLDNEIAAVLNACVLVPMPLCDTLLRCAEDPGLFRALWSEQILEEVKRTLLGKFGYTPEQIDYRLRMMHEAFPEATVSVPPDLLRPDGIWATQPDGHLRTNVLYGPMFDWPPTC
jgi:hypothetical protein